MAFGLIVDAASPFGLVAAVAAGLVTEEVDMGLAGTAPPGVGLLAATPLAPLLSGGVSTPDAGETAVEAGGL